MEHYTFSGKASAARRARKKRISGKDLLWAVLCILVPPLGILLIFGNRSFTAPVRAALTAAGTLVMVFALCMMFPRTVVRTSTVQPVPTTPGRVEEASQSDVMSSLSNMDQLLRSQEKTEDATTQVDPQIASAEQMQLEAEKQALLNTIVYTVYGSNARYYHATEYCGNQHNRRQMTLAEALAARMGACPDCHAPTFNYLSTETVLGD